MIKAIVFDWGDTVMKVFPEFDGPMFNWPQVAGIPGIQAALSELKPKYRLAIATNAADSGEKLVRAALKRLNLEEYFDAVFTARELGKRKPDPDFFRSVVDRLETRPDETVMIGDDYVADIVGAKQAGLRAFWYTPQQKESPSKIPQFDRSLSDMLTLPALLSRPYWPDVPQCITWMREQGAADGLLQHTEAVGWVAYRIALKMEKAGIPVDPILAHRGGLLHDLDKIIAVRHGRVHGELSADLLTAWGEPVLARIALTHLISRLRDPENFPASWEEKLVFYADKIVEGDRVVGVKSRLLALAKRYPQFAGEMEEVRPGIMDLENEICVILNLLPEQLTSFLMN